MVCFALPNFVTLWTISPLHELRSNYRLLRYDRRAKPVILSIITLNLKTETFSGLGEACPSHKAKLGKILTFLKKIRQ